MKDKGDNLTEFRVKIIGEICEYAKKNNLDPNATLKNVAETIILVTTIGSFDEYED